ncbi:MAG: hypothetical protein V4568_04915 [Pseudomonadota bacterium]
MKNIKNLSASTLVLLLLGQVAFAYEVQTHETLSEAALNGSVLKTDSSVLARLGLEPLDRQQKFPGSDGQQEIVNLFKIGANLEDTSIRAINHFYDPITDNGVAFTSPTWTLEDKGSIPRQNYSFRDTRDYFYKALTQPSKTDREQYFGLTFEALGHVIHHVQDMAQPQHTRLDNHLNLGWTQQELPIENRSRYEEYSNDVRSNLPITGYSPVKFSRLRDFWKTGTGAGMGEFSNRNFVTDGTNFTLRNGQAVAGTRYALPAPNGTSEEKALVDILAEKGQPLPSTLQTRCAARSACLLTFYASTVRDVYTQSTSVNPRASTLSIFDQDLKMYGRTIVYLDPDSLNFDSANTYTIDRLFVLNRFNFDEAHKFLIPRAVAYSTGLINYFFRGKMDWVADSANSAMHAIKNLGEERMNGTFEIYYDAVDGKRYLIKSWLLDINPGMEVGGLNFERSANPAPKNPGEYMLVFNGDMGEEKKDSDLRGAVVAKFIEQKTGMLISVCRPGCSGTTFDIYRSDDLSATCAICQHDQRWQSTQSWKTDTYKRQRGTERDEYQPGWRAELAPTGYANDI